MKRPFLFWLIPNGHCKYAQVSEAVEAATCIMQLCTHFARISVNGSGVELSGRHAHMPKLAMSTPLSGLSVRVPSQSSSFLGLPYRILNTNHKKKLLWSLWVMRTSLPGHPSATKSCTRTGGVDTAKLPSYSTLVQPHTGKPSL